MDEMFASIRERNKEEPIIPGSIMEEFTIESTTYPASS
jgi:hypothetical protein